MRGISFLTPALWVAIGLAAMRAAAGGEALPLAHPPWLRDAINAVDRSLPAVSPDDWKAMAPAPKQRLAWLAKDFGSRAFIKADRLSEALLQRQMAGQPLHLELWLLHFPTCRALADARAAVKKVARSNFELPVLTVFRTRAREHDLVFLVSETPFHPHVQALFKNLGTVLGNETPCAH